jgi:hypothetical protein
MDIFFICAGVVYVTIVLSFIWIATNSPEGYEDNEGFHCGRPCDASVENDPPADDD